MNEKLNEALNEIRDRYITQAAHSKRKKQIFWLGAVAAILAVAILASALTGPMAVQASAISLAAPPRITDFPALDDYKDHAQWQAAWNTWQAELDTRQNTTSTALAQLSDFFTQGNEQFLSGSEGNLLWSPINAGIGLAMVAEVTGGNSRQQILDLLGVDSIDALRSQVSALWESAYCDDGHNICALANSLWIEKELPFHPEAADALSYHYYADVYQGDLGSKEINEAIGTWLNDCTGGLLKDAADNISLSQETILALYSTLYFQAKWQDQFQSKNNTDGVFHAVSGDKTVTYMNRKLAEMYYYWGDTFSAVSLRLKNGSQMWFILPDDGLTTGDVLSDRQYMELFSANTYENRKYMKVNLSVPKFDVSKSQNLQQGLSQMGVTDVFSSTDADFSAITDETPVFLAGANQSVRVQIDKEGVKAAAYIEFPAPGSPPPPEETIDFVLDRPFLFLITNNNIPLFAGTVNEP